MCASLLVVEDDEMISEFLVDNLRQDGHAVTVVGTVTDALVALRRARTEIALIDVSLPDGSGLDVVRMIRSGEAGASDIGVVVVSGRGTEQDRIRAFERGVDDYIVKPFNYPELLLRTASLEARLSGRVASVLT
ncbi:MAG: response regulator transcription factor, partial [Thermoleophilia bacterium]|nr:response regulator transcription factor [Thermoleophilia bacterium]